MHRNETLEPFFIVGSGRSGNTLLRRILNNHSELFIPPETYVLGESVRQYLRYPRIKWEDLVRLVLANFQLHREFATFRLASLAPLLAELSALPVAQRSLAAILHGFFAHYGSQDALPSFRWGDKTPINVFFLDELHGAFPRARFIHMLRDPCDVAHSYVVAGLCADVVSATDRWLRSVGAARAFGRRFPERYLELEYAELVNQPERAARAVAEFIGVDYEAGMLGLGDQDLGDVAVRRGQ